MPTPPPRLMRMLLFISLAMFVTGIFSPLLTVEKFIFIENTFSLVSAITRLWREDRYTLSFLLGGFSVALPLVKFLILFRALRISGAAQGQLNPYLRWIHDYGRWSMLDVFVVALMIVALKLGILFEVHVHYGLYLFSAAIVLTMVLTGWIVRMSEQAQARV